MRKLIKKVADIFSKKPAKIEAETHHLGEHVALFLKESRKYFKKENGDKEHVTCL
jgi:hypothetical protein